MESQKQPAANKQPLLSNKEVDDLFFWAGVIRWEFLPDKLAFDIPTVVLEHFGYSKDETPLSMERWLQLIHPDDQQTAKYNFQELIQGRIPYFEMKYRIRTANGEYRYFFSRGGLNSLHSNPLNACISGTLQDVTESESAVRSLHKRDKLLKAINTAAGIILNDYETGFDSCMKEIIFLLGEATNSDRCIIWKNTTDSDGQDCAEIAYEWSPNAKPQQHDKNRNRFRYQESLPFFKQSLQAGGCISSYVKDLPEPERSCLAAGNITSILLAPILVHNDFWGFIALDNCRDGQIWDKVECDLMNSVGGIIASSIKRKNVEAVLSEERQTLNWIVDAAHHPMMISSDGVISRINKAAKKVFGLDIGDNVSSVYPPELNRDEVLQSIREAGFFYRQSVSFNCADGQHRYFSAQILPFKLFNEKQLILWANDITAIKETEQKLIAERQKAENALKVKSEFLARMSHEIRTPMNAVIGMIYLCLQTELADNQKDYLVKATTAANNLLGIINDILDFSKIEANRIELESITFSVRKLVGDVSDLMSIQLEEKNIDLKVHIADDIDNYLLGDPLRLRQILINLLSNAAKFTSVGGITIYIVKIPSDNVLDDSVKLKFAVSDTGIGIAESQISSIFDSFTQAEGSISRKFGGTGLGLAIVKRLVELMGGTISVTSKIDIGSIFEFTAVFSKAITKPEESSAVLLDRKRVLIVDDDENSCKILAKLVQSMGMYAEEVHSGAAALDHLLSVARTGPTFDLILMDWRMPRMDGIETIRQIRQHRGDIPPLHILMVSAYDRQDCMRMSTGTNVAGFLLKPIDPAELKRTLKQVFLHEAQLTVEEIKTDIRGAKILLAEDNKINQLVAEGLLKILGVELTIVGSGKEAVEAVKKDNYDLILMDVQMPEMDGLEATKIIRTLDKPGVDGLPILAMTANAMDSDYHKSIEAGMNDHLTKPIDPDKLRLALEKWIQR